MPGQYRYGVLQYVLVKPTCALITFVSGAAGIYGSHTFSLARLHFYVFFVSSTSQVPRPIEEGGFERFHALYLKAMDGTWRWRICGGYMKGRRYIKGTWRVYIHKAKARIWR